MFDLGGTKGLGVIVLMFGRILGVEKVGRTGVCVVERESGEIDFGDSAFWT